MLKPGTQIARVPHHAYGDLDHRDVEFGFVTGNGGRDLVFCRYWRRDMSGLRTKANSEPTPMDYIIIVTTVPQSRVDELMKEMGYGTR